MNEAVETLEQIAALSVAMEADREITDDTPSSPSMRNASGISMQQEMSLNVDASQRISALINKVRCAGALAGALAVWLHSSCTELPLAALRRSKLWCSPL